MFGYESTVYRGVWIRKYGLERCSDKRGVDKKCFLIRWIRIREVNEVGSSGVEVTILEWYG